MAAPQAAGTPAATPAAPAPTETIDAGTHGIAAVLGDLTAEDAEPSAPAAEAPEGEPAEQEATEQEPADAAQKLDDEVIFSDEALETKEGILKARARVRELRKKGHETYLGLKKYDSRLKERGAKLKVSVDRFVADKRNHQLLLDNVRSNLQGLHSGDPDAILTALGNLTGTDGVKAYELLTSRIVNRGRPALDPQVQAIIDAQNARIEQLTQGFTQEKTQAKVSQLNQQIEQRKQGIGEHITSNAEQFPNLARVFADNPKNTIDYIADEIIEAHAAGTPVDKSTYFVQLEAQLAKHFTGAGPAAKAEGGDSAPKQSTPTVQRSPGQSVGPRTAAASTPRVPTEDEALRALSQDEAFMSSLFG